MTARVHLLAQVSGLPADLAIQALSAADEGSQIVLVRNGPKCVGFECDSAQAAISAVQHAAAALRNRRPGDSTSFRLANFPGVVWRAEIGPPDLTYVVGGPKPKYFSVTPRGRAAKPAVTPTRRRAHRPTAETHVAA